MLPAEPLNTDILDLDLQRHEYLQLHLPVVEHPFEDAEQRALE